MKFSERVVAAVLCPWCLAEPGKLCTRKRADPTSGPSRDLYHDSRAQVFEDGPCGPVETIGRREWCVKPRGHGGQHDYDYRPEARARANAR